MPEYAMVFAAGFGKRMLPITKTLPKPMVEVCGKPLVDYALDGLADAGIKKAVVNTHHLADTLEGHLKGRKSLPEITISYEKDILETGGGLLKALPFLGGDSFFSVNSDVIVVGGGVSHFKRMASLWNPEKMDVLMLLQPVEKAVGYEGRGDFDLTEDGRITRLFEARAVDPGMSYPYVFSGVMLSKTQIYNGLEVKPFSIYRDFIKPKYVQGDGSLSRVYGVVHDGDWVHVGTPDSVKIAEKYLSDKVGVNENIHNSR